MCSICKQITCPLGCPNYAESKSDMYCSICGLAILPGHEYAINEHGEYAHSDCIGNYYDLAEFGGVRFEEKELENYDIY